MPLWLWLALMAVGLAFVAFRRYGEHAALKRRQQELAAQRFEREQREGETARWWSMRVNPAGSETGSTPRPTARRYALKMST